MIPVFRKPIAFRHFRSVLLRSFSAAWLKYFYKNNRYNQGRFSPVSRRGAVCLHFNETSFLCIVRTGNDCPDLWDSFLCDSRILLLLGSHFSRKSRFLKSHFKKCTSHSELSPDHQEFISCKICGSGGRRHLGECGEYEITTLGCRKGTFLSLFENSVSADFLFVKPVHLWD